MKKILCLFLLGMFLLNTNSFASFIDVTEDDWFYEPVQYAYKQDILRGVGDGLFAPQGTMTRAMVVQALYNIEGKPEVNGYNKYIDVNSSEWYEKAIIWVTENNIVNGAATDKFFPDALITRDQMVTLLHRYAQHKEYDVSVGENTNILSYNDVSKISEYAIPAMQWACGAKIISGYNGDLFPKNNLTRAEFATIIRNLDTYYPRPEIGWIELKGNGSNNCAWFAVGYDNSVIKVDDYIYLENPTNLDEGIFKFKITALKEGKSKIDFYYMSLEGEYDIFTIMECEVEVFDDLHMNISTLTDKTNG